MLVDKTIDNGLEKAKQFAKQIGKLDNLIDKLEYLEHYKNDECICYVYNDFEKFSFIFEIFLNGEHWLTGGLIYHGAYDGFGSGGAPTFSVCIEPTDGWSIHT